eukprot:2168003-Amphidinium_carterae.1
MGNRRSSESSAAGDFFDGLDGFELASNVEEADFILASGVESMFAGTAQEVQTNYERDGDVAPFLPMLQVAAERQLLLICSNPDVRVRRPGGSSFCQTLLIWMSLRN